jgi:hypothetical protein
MMKNSRRWPSLLGVLLLAGPILASCGNGGAPVEDPFGSLTGSTFVFIGDAPPAGSSILKFEITVTGAVLCPQVSGSQCQGSPQVQLLTEAVEIELHQLELESAFLALRSAPLGTYAGVQLTFANPELKLLQSDGTVVELEGTGLPLNPTTVVVSFSQPLNIQANEHRGFLIDFNVRDSIQSSGASVTGVAPVVSLVELPVVTGQAIHELEDTKGTVSNLAKTCPTGTFTLTDSLTGLPITNIRFDATTEFDDDLTCETFANGQVVEAEIEFRSPGQQAVEFFAKEIELVNPGDEDELEGLVFAVNSASEFVLLVQNEHNVPNLSGGNFVTVTLDPEGVEFRIDMDDLPVESVDFDAGGDLIVGQRLEVKILDGTLEIATGGCGTVDAGCAAMTRRLKLKKSTLTGRVAFVAAPDFTLDQLPSLFGHASLFRPITADCQACFVDSIQVATSDQTQFEGGLTDVNTMPINVTVTVRGLLVRGQFAGPGPMSTFPPRFIARKVRQRTPSP